MCPWRGEAMSVQGRKHAWSLWCFLSALDATNQTKRKWLGLELQLLAEFAGASPTPPQVVAGVAGCGSVGLSAEAGTVLSELNQSWLMRAVERSPGRLGSSFSSHSFQVFCCRTPDNCSLIGWHEIKTVSTLSRIISFSWSLPPVERSPFIRPKNCSLVAFMSREECEHRLGRGERELTAKKNYFSCLSWGEFIWCLTKWYGGQRVAPWVMSVDQVCFLHWSDPALLPFCVGTDRL